MELASFGDFFCNERPWITYLNYLCCNAV